MVTLNTSPGDGGLRVGVDAFGSFGSGVGGLETSDAFYDPLGDIEEAGTVFESYLAIGVNNDENPERIILSESNLGASDFSDNIETSAESTFDVSGLNFVLQQEVTDFPNEEDRTGSNLIQSYTITNTTETTVEFDIIRYLDGDLSFDGSPLDSGGLYFEDGSPILFETDSGDSEAFATTFVGIANTSSVEPVSSGYEISQYSGLRNAIDIKDEALLNFVQGDGDDEDLFVDGEPYDITLGLSDDFVLEPGESLTYNTSTYFGTGTPENFQPQQTTSDTDPTGIPVYRFLRNDTQTQFYTTSEVERDTILDTLPQYELEGVSFVGAPNGEGEEDPLTGTSPVYRFFNNSTGIHLYTADENERAFVENNLDNYVSEGTPYYGYDTQVEGTVPLYRFYNADLDAHFYTPNAEERDSFIESPDYQPEGGGDGIAFYVEPASEI